MDIVSSLILGLVQGLTEFLPVSSSGHLVIVQGLIPGFTQPGILYDVVLHLGTLAAVIFYFKDRLSKMDTRSWLLVFVGTLPAIIVGLLFKDQLEAMFVATKWVGVQLIITGILNLLVDKMKSKPKDVSYGSSLMMGISQAIAIIPGISRSGATIFTGSALGINKEKVAEFSFIMSIPAIVGANALEIFSHWGKLDGGHTEIYMIGFLAALISGYISIRMVFKFLSQKKFKLFAYYCFLVGALALLFF